MGKLVDFHASNEWPRERHQTHNSEPSLARQEFAEECDINSLMARYEKHAGTGPGNLPSMGDPSQMFYADFTTMPGSLLEYVEFMDQADKAFMSLPAAVRKEFENSPHQFVEFASDPENLPQMRTWGLAAPEPQEPPPQKVEIVGGGAPPAASGAAGGASTHGST